MLLLTQNIKDYMHLDIQHKKEFIFVQFKRNCSLNQTNLEEFKFQVLGSVEPSNTVILNFENLEYIDSAGLTTLIHIRKKILSMNGKLLLTNVSMQIQKLLQITRLHRFFEVFNSLEEAVSSLKKTAPDRSKDHPFTLKLQVKHTDTFSIVRIKQPDSLIATNSEAFKKKILEYLSTRNAAILDFNKLRNIDSTGIACLIHLKKFVRKNNKKIILVYQDSVITRLFKLYSIEDLFPQFTDSNLAVQSLKQNIQINKLEAATQNTTPQEANNSSSFLTEEFEDILFLTDYQK